MTIRQTLLLWIAALLLGCSQPVHFNATDISGADWGKDFQLTDSHGQQRRLVDFKDKAVVVFFGYTQCPDVCPTTLSTMRDTLARMGDSASRVQVVFITLDPARDGAPMLGDYVAAFHPSFIGLYGDEATTAATAKDFKVFYSKHPGSSADSYSIDHSTSSYAFDPQGRLRLLIRHGDTPENIAADLKLLLAGK